MMYATTSNTRRKKIFQAIVEAYIEMATPISSQLIARRFRWRISAATIRNAMAELDDLGLIWQPHTSAGRIPTDKGYRYYINSLLEVERLTLQEMELIESRYPSENEAFDELLAKVLHTLSSFSGYTAIAFSSGVRKILFKKLELVSVHSKKLLVVLVSPEGLVKTTVLQMPYEIDQVELVKIAKFLNEEFTGLTLERIKERLSLKLLHSSDVFFHLLKETEQILDLALSSLDKDKLYLEGTSYILEQPEFQDTQKLQAILRVFERQEPLLKIMKDDLGQDGVKVHIGRENVCTDIQECSLVTSNFKIRDKNMGSLGIIGPLRMSYAKAISLVTYMAEIFNRRFNNLSFDWDQRQR